MPYDRSSWNVSAPSSNSKKLGQPQPLSNFVSLWKSGAPDTGSTKVPQRFSLRCSLENGGSVPCSNAMCCCTEDKTYRPSHRQKSGAVVWVEKREISCFPENRTIVGLVDIAVLSCHSLETIDLFVMLSGISDRQFAKTSRCRRRLTGLASSRKAISRKRGSSRGWEGSSCG